MLIPIVLALLAFSSAQTDFQVNDVKTLNFALTLEHLEYAFYRDALNNVFTDASFFVNAGYNATIYNYFQLIMAHERSHVQILTSVINARGGVPVPECQYNFNYGTDVNTFILLARTFENTGVTAYDGSINTITELLLQTYAATIATVEARHAAFLNYLTNEAPFSSPMDNATSPTDIITAVSTFIVPGSCGNTTTSMILPQPATFPENQLASTGAANTAAYNDVATLQLALFVENWDMQFFNLGIQTFNESAFNAAGYPGVYEYVNTLAQNEVAHAFYLQAAINASGNQGVQPCQYNFAGTMTSVTQFLVTGRMFEQVGVSAYDGGVNAISDLTVRTAAATIATVEGRHASFLNEITNAVPFPNVTEPTLTPAQVIAHIMPYLVDPTCGGQLTLNAATGDYYIKGFALPVPANFTEAAQAGPFKPTTGVNVRSTTGAFINNIDNASSVLSVSFALVLSAFVAVLGLSQ